MESSQNLIGVPYYACGSLRANVSNIAMFVISVLGGNVGKKRDHYGKKPFRTLDDRKIRNMGPL